MKRRNVEDPNASLSLAQKTEWTDKKIFKKVANRKKLYENNVQIDSLLFKTCIPELQSLVVHLSPF